LIVESLRKLAANTQSVLAFTRDKRLRIVWGGVDLQTRLARTPQELAAWILKGKLLDGQTIHLVDCGADEVES
jgi:hypothetical protein